MEHFSNHLCNHIFHHQENIKIRHVVSDLFNYVGHYKHGFMNKYGRYIDHPTDTLLDPEDEFATDWDDDDDPDACDALLLNSGMDCQQKDYYCTGLAFSVGVGGDITQGSMSIGGGVDFGFGLQDENGEKYEETYVWGVCGGHPGPPDPEDVAKGEALEVGISVGMSVGAWTNTGHIPGYADTVSISLQVAAIEIGITLVETYANEEWQNSNGYHGFLLEVSASFPAGAGIGFTDAKCYGEAIEKGEYPLTLRINVDNRDKYEVCGPNTYSLNIKYDESTSYSQTRTGLTLYWYKNEEDWEHRKNRQYIVHWSGNGAAIFEMGHGDHFESKSVYGVGIAAHGNDPFWLGSASLHQNVGAAWTQRWAANELSLCISTNYNGCYPNIEFKVGGDVGRSGVGNNDVVWRSGHERVPKDKRIGSEDVYMIYQTDVVDTAKCGMTNNYGCGGNLKLSRFAPCNAPVWFDGTYPNADQVMDINGDWKTGCQG